MDIQDSISSYIYKFLAVFNRKKLSPDISPSQARDASFPTSYGPEAGLYTLRLPARRAIELGEAGSADKLVPRLVRGTGIWPKGYFGQECYNMLTVWL